MGGIYIQGKTLNAQNISATGTVKFDEVENANVEVLCSDVEGININCQGATDCLNGARSIADKEGLIIGGSRLCFGELSAMKMIALVGFDVVDAGMINW
jgi:hypothetical protein